MQCCNEWQSTDLIEQFLMNARHELIIETEI